MVVTPGNQGLFLTKGANIVSGFRSDSGFVMKYENEVSPTGNENIRSDGFFAIGVMVSSFVGFHHCNVRESGVDLVTVCPKCSVSTDFLGEDFTAFRVPV